MAKIIYQPWIVERFRNPDAEELEVMTLRYAVLEYETQRRVLQLPGGEDDLRTDPEFTDEHRDYLAEVNAGKEVPRIKEIRLDRSERNLLNELGKGQPAAERKRLRTQFEADFLMAELGKLAPTLGAERRRRDPQYPPMRRRQLETMLDKFTDQVGLGSDIERFLRFAIFTPHHDYGLKAIRHGDEELLIWDVREDRLHKLHDTSEGKDLDYMLSPCEGAFVDLEQNPNLRTLAMVYLASPSGEAPSPCERCLPEGIGEGEVNLYGPVSRIVTKPLIPA